MGGALTFFHFITLFSFFSYKLPKTKYNKEEERREEKKFPKPNLELATFEQKKIFFFQNENDLSLRVSALESANREYRQVESK